MWYREDNRALGKVRGARTGTATGIEAGTEGRVEGRDGPGTYEVIVCMHVRSMFSAEYESTGVFIPIVGVGKERRTLIGPWWPVKW